MHRAAAIALGAIVAPPDAAATAVLRQLRPPCRLLVVLEGESLFNDASALLIYRLAVGAALAGSISGWSVLPMLLVDRVRLGDGCRVRGDDPRTYGVGDGRCCVQSPAKPPTPWRQAWLDR